MHGKIILEVTDGTDAGQKYEYTGTNRVFIGRQDDCGIVLSEKTVSRYHCILTINPPTVRLQDFGSLNGTYINGEKIGQRDRDKSWEEAKNEVSREFDLHDGDRIRLGKRCELKCSIEQEIISDVTISDEDLGPSEEERIKIEKAEKEKQKMQARGGGKKTCQGCGKPFVPKAEDNNLCPECLADRAKILDGILAAILGDAMERKEPSKGASPVEGYDKVALLGKGGMGEVWKVRERSTGKILALKTMLPQVAADEKGKKMFLREASLCEQLNHKNVVKTYQTGCANGVFYILMDLCQGGSAQDLMERNRGRLSLNMATYIILQALTGLDYVHNLDVSVEIRKKGLWSSGTKQVEAHGLVHRDFKPGNIFLSDRSDHPVAMVADFGMAKAFETAGMTDMTSSGQASGTVAFMPRQQALDYRFSKPEVDVWAAAASYYYMLTGMPPKNLKPQPLLWQSLVQEPAVPIRKRNSAIPARIAEVIDRALVERPEIGCKTAAALRRDIIAALPAETKAYCKGIL